MFVGHYPFLACSEWVLSSSLWWMTRSGCHLNLSTPTETDITSYITGQIILITLHWLPGFLNTRFATQNFLSQKENSDKRKYIYETASREKKYRTEQKIFYCFLQRMMNQREKNKTEANRVKVLMFVVSPEWSFPLYCSSVQNINLNKQTWRIPTIDIINHSYLV